MRFDATAKIVDRIVAGDDACAGRGVAPVERVDRDANRIADERAESNDVEPRAFECLVICDPQFLSYSSKCSAPEQGPQYRAKVPSPQRNEWTCALYQTIR